MILTWRKSVVLLLSAAMLIGCRNTPQRSVPRWTPIPDHTATPVQQATIQSAQMIPISAETADQLGEPTVIATALNWITGLDFSPTSDHVAIAGEHSSGGSGDIFLWSLTQGREIPHHLTSGNVPGGHQWTNALLYDRTGRYLIRGTQSSSGIVDMSGNRDCGYYFPIADGNVVDASISAEAWLLATAHAKVSVSDYADMDAAQLSEWNAVITWDLAGMDLSLRRAGVCNSTATLRKTPGIVSRMPPPASGETPESVALSPDGAWLAVGW